MSYPTIQTILVCQGAEYQAVCRGLSSVTGVRPTVVPLPIGTIAVTRFLKTQQARLLQPHSPLLVMGLCGSLNARHGAGEAVLYRECLYATGQDVQTRMCDRRLTEWLHHQVPSPSPVTAFTSDRVIHLAQKKYALAQQYGADVVDMEGFAVLETLQPQGVDIAMLRVISDDCDHDMPNLNAAVDSAGKLQPVPMALEMLRHPIAASRLIRGSLRGLKRLQALTTTLFQTV